MSEGVVDGVLDREAALLVDVEGLEDCADLLGAELFG